MRGRVEPVPAISLLGGACMSYTFSLSRRSLPVRCLCLLLIVLVLWCFFMVPRAGAVALEATSVAYAGLLVGTLLVGAGVAFSNPGDMAKAGNAMYRTLQKGNEAIASKIAAISVWAVDHGKRIGSAALRIGKDLYQGIIDAFNSAYSDGVFSVSGSSFTLSDSTSSDAISALDSWLSGYGIGAVFRVDLPSTFTSTGWYTQFYSTACNPTYGWFLEGDSADVNTMSDVGSLMHLPCRIGVQLESGTAKLGIWSTYKVDVGLSPSFYGLRNLWDGAVFTFVDMVSCKAGDLAYPSDNSLVKLPDIPSVDTATGEVTYPDSIAYTKDAVAAPYPIGDDGVKVPDIPYDIPVDQTSGKPMDDTGTDTDTPSKPGEGADTGSNTGLLQKILDLLKNFFDSPSDFRLNMDGFRNLAIKDKFPFCIPFDMVDSVKQFAADAADYQFRVKLDTQYFKVDHVVDLTPLAVPLAFFRYLVVAWFAWVLMSRTHDLMKW